MVIGRIISFLHDEHLSHVPVCIMANVFFIRSQSTTLAAAKYTTKIQTA